MNISALSALAAAALPNSGSTNGVAGDAPLALFAELLGTQIQGGFTDSATLAAATTADLEQSDKLLRFSANDTEKKSATDPAEPELTDIAAWLAALPGMPTVNPENQPNLKLPQMPEIESALEGIDPKSGKQRNFNYAPADNLGIEMSASATAGLENNPPQISVENRQASPFQLALSSAQNHLPGGTISSQQPDKAAIIAGDSIGLSSLPDSAIQLTPPQTPLQATPAASDPAANLTATVHAPLHDRNWGSQFADKVIWMARADVQSAQIHIHPAQLGPVQITVNLNGDQANITFASPHAEVRQAIESALPQLKDMLSTSGIALGDANVGANLARRDPESHFQSANRTPSGSENAILPANEQPAETVGRTIIHRGRGMVDLFA